MCHELKELLDVGLEFIICVLAFGLACACTHFFLHHSFLFFPFVPNKGKHRSTLCQGLLPYNGCDNVVSSDVACLTFPLKRSRVQPLTEEEEVELVIKRMIDANVKEIAVITGERKIIADVTMPDLLKALGDI